MSDEPTPPDGGSIRRALRVPAGDVTLAGFDPSARPLAPTRKNSNLVKDAAALRAMQERLWAESTQGGKRRILLVLQGMDTCGKGGVAEHVVGEFGPIGVQYTAFKAPTKEEQDHDFLWRIRQKLPPAGVVGVFDRSHYEDVLIVRVHGLVPQTEWEARYDQINAFESELVDGGTTLIKCFLHISYDTQRERLLKRLKRPDKHWKFSESDIDERSRWADYQVAYEAMLDRTNTEHAPWYLVPADHKKYRNWAIGELLRETLEELDPHYPEPGLDVPRLRARLQPPH